VDKCVFVDKYSTKPSTQKSSDRSESLRCTNGKN